MSNKLYVGNIAWGLDEAGLEGIFSDFGGVQSVKIIKDRDTGRSKGFGFVEMSSGDEAQTAIQNLDGKEFEGRQLRVNVAKEREERPRRNF